MANAAIDIYLATAVLSRTTWEIERAGGEDAARSAARLRAVFIPMAYAPRASQHPRAPRESGRAAEGDRRTVAGERRARPRAADRRVAITRMGKLVVLMFVAFVDMVGSSMILPLVPYYATRMGATGLAVGIILAAFSLGQLVSAPSWGRFSDRYGRRPAILLGLALSVVAYVVFAFSNSARALVDFATRTGIGAGTVGVLQAYVTDSMGVRTIARRASAGSARRPASVSSSAPRSVRF